MRLDDFLPRLVDGQDSRLASVVVFSFPVEHYPVELEQILDSAESARLASIRVSNSRSQYAVSAIALRLVAGGYLRRHPAMVVVDRSCATCDCYHGPARIQDSPVKVSVSRSSCHVLVAVSNRSAVGVDIESVGNARCGPLPEFVLSPSERSWLSGQTTGVSDSFLALWTAKEAFSKLSGRGLSADFASIEMLDVPLRGWIEAEGEPRGEPRMAVVQFRPYPCCVAAVACPAKTQVGYANAMLTGFSDTRLSYRAIWPKWNINQGLPIKL